MWPCHISLLPYSPLCFFISSVRFWSFPSCLCMLFLSRVYLFSQFLITNLQEKIINSDPVPFVTRFIPVFDPIYRTFCKLIPLRGVISYIRYEFHMTSEVFSLAKVPTTSRTTQATCHFPGQCQSLPLDVIPGWPALCLQFLSSTHHVRSWMKPHTSS